MKKMHNIPLWSNRRYENARALILILFAVFAANSLVYGQETKFRGAFLNDYEPHAAKLQEFYSNVFVKYTRTNEGGGDGGSQVMDVELKVNFRNHLARVTGNRFIDNKTKETRQSLGLSVGGRNPYYYFDLSPTSEEKFRLLDLKLASEKVYIPETRLRFPFFYAPRSQTYLELARDDKVVITGYKDVVWDNRKAKELSFEYDFYSYFLKKNVHTKLKCYFLPNAGWVCGGIADAESKDIFSYEENRTGELPVPKRDERFVGSRIRFTTEITEFRRMPPFDDAEFRLTAFGLPEPMGVPPVNRGGMRWYIWIALAAFGSLVLSLLFWRFARHLREKKAVAAIQS